MKYTFNEVSFILANAVGLVSSYNISEEYATRISNTSTSTNIFISFAPKKHNDYIFPATAVASYRFGHRHLQDKENDDPAMDLLLDNVVKYEEDVFGMTIPSLP